MNGLTTAMAFSTKAEGRMIRAIRPVTQCSRQTMPEQWCAQTLAQTTKRPWENGASNTLNKYFLIINVLT